MYKNSVIFDIRKMKKRITLSDILKEARVWRRDGNSGDMPVDKGEVMVLIGQRFFVVDEDRGEEDGPNFKLVISSHGFGFVHYHVVNWWEGFLPPRRFHRW
jgi:hypothetical protein